METQTQARNKHLYEKDEYDLNLLKDKYGDYTIEEVIKEITIFYKFLRKDIEGFTYSKTTNTITVYYSY